jgi:hypothetical protein
MDHERRERAEKLLSRRFSSWSLLAHKCPEAAVDFALAFSDQETASLRAELAKARTTLEEIGVIASAKAEWSHTRDSTRLEHVAELAKGGL